MKRQHHLKPASLSNYATHFDAAMMFFHDAAGQGEPQAGATALGGVERPKDVGQGLRLDPTPGVADNHTGAVLSRTNFGAHRARTFHGLNSVQKQIQKDCTGPTVVAPFHFAEPLSEARASNRMRLNWDDLSCLHVSSPHNKDKKASLLPSLSDSRQLSRSIAQARG